MKQSELLAQVMAMKPGEAVRLPYEEIRAAADGQFSSGFDRAREEDVKNFCQTIETNWDLSITHDPVRNLFTIHKLREASHQQTEATLPPRV